MPEDFFVKKRPWSRYKDLILGYYLEPYIPKVAKLGRPVLIVDCFAGKGQFDDGTDGSPLIIANRIRHWKDKLPNTEIHGHFIESDSANYQHLVNCLAPFRAISTVHPGRFEDHVDEIARLASRNTVFLYVDPYKMRGLHFDAMRRVYDQIHKASSSVELLLNLNVVDFLRWATAALGRLDQWLVDQGYVGADGFEDWYTSAEPQELTAIAGGDYWREIVSNDTIDFPLKVTAFAQVYAQLLRRSFRHVCSYPVKERYVHKVPKYMLQFGTRHHDGLELMNDAMCRAREEFLKSEFVADRIFDVTPETETPDFADLDRDLCDQLRMSHRMRRKDLRSRVLPKWFGRLTTSEINRRIQVLLKSQAIYSSTGKARISDPVELSLSPFES